MLACLQSGLLETLVETLPDPDTPHLKTEHLTPGVDSRKGGELAWEN